MSPPDRPLRVALLTYRGDPHCGGQGVYVRHLSAALSRLGHRVEVLSGPPYPDLQEDVPLQPLPSLDLYAEPGLFRPKRALGGPVDALEVGLMSTGAFPEPLTFSLRARRFLRANRGRFDVVHDNQCLGWGLPAIARDLPVLATVHHPITVDRAVDLARAENLRERVRLRRSYSFVRMQVRVARMLPRLITVSEASKRDLVEQFGVRTERLAVVPIGVDPQAFRPLPEVARIPGRLIVTTRADTPLKGLPVLLEALAKVRTERPAHLVVVGAPPRPGGICARALERFGVAGAVRFTGPLPQSRLVGLYAEAEVAVVPSLYEGFSLPAVEAMACALPLVATTGGALPEVTGADGQTVLQVPPANPGALAAALLRVLDDGALRRRLGGAGRERVLGRFTWDRTARATAGLYRELTGC